MAKEFAIVVDTICQGVVAAAGDIYKTMPEAQAELADLTKARSEADMDDGGYYIIEVEKTGDQYMDAFGQEVTVIGEVCQ